MRWAVNSGEVTTVGKGFTNSSFPLVLENIVAIVPKTGGGLIPTHKALGLPVIPNVFIFLYLNIIWDGGNEMLQYFNRWRCW